MNKQPMTILLADDDIDDCGFFKEALAKLPIITSLNSVHDGEQLMKLLNQENYTLPDVLFLDLNMSRKNGFECLEEIKGNERLKRLPVIIFSTSFDKDRVNLLYENGAHYFMRKPAEFIHLKNLIHQGISHVLQDLSSGKIMQPQKENFVLTFHSRLVD
jgi:CheY-like chemotaxis protein